MLLLIIGFVLGLNNINTDQYNKDLTQSLNTINSSVASVPILLPATATQVTNAEIFSNKAFQASQAIGENEPDSIPIFSRFLPLSGHYEAQRNISNAKDILAGPRQSLLQASLDSEYLLKFIFYAPAEEFANYGQNELLDDERIQRTKQGFKSIIDNPSLSETYKEDITKAMKALEELEKNKDIKLYIKKIAQIQLQITEKLNATVAKEKTAVNDLYNNYLYQ
jgi:hypothetical protein